MIATNYQPYAGSSENLTITEDQVYFLQWCMRTWFQVKRDWQAGFDRPNLPVDIEKSCLMYRLSVEGKPPLPIPPPTAMSAPWYKLIEDGKAGITQNIFQNFYIHPKDQHENMQDYYTRWFQDDGIEQYWGWANIHQHMWCVLEADLYTYVVTYRNSKGERWILRQITAHDEPIVAGKTKNHLGEWVDFYCDWILIREDLDAKTS